MTVPEWLGTEGDAPSPYEEAEPFNALAELRSFVRRQHAEVQALYAERNAVVLAFAQAARNQSFAVGKSVDPAEPDWPVLLIDTPFGQVSWHLRAEEMPAGMPDYPGEWDGHDTAEKYERLRALVALQDWRTAGG